MAAASRASKVMLEAFRYSGSLRQTPARRASAAAVAVSGVSVKRELPSRVARPHVSLAYDEATVVAPVAAVDVEPFAGAAPSAGAAAAEPTDTVKTEPPSSATTVTPSKRRRRLSSRSAGASASPASAAAAASAASSSIVHGSGTKKAVVVKAEYMGPVGYATGRVKTPAKKQALKRDFSTSSADGVTSAQETPAGASAAPPPPLVTKKEKNGKLKRSNSAPATPGGTKILPSKAPQPPPEGWLQQYENIRRMRKNRDAPVDTLGCEVLALKDAPEHVQRFHHLVALMLSSQTKDEYTAGAMHKLFAFGLTPEKIANTPEKTLAPLLKPVGFYHRKATYLRKTSQILVDKYGGDIPPTIEEMLELPGVGPKMAFLTMGIAWKKPIGIGVDVHVHRISNTLGWVRTPSPEHTRVELESWLPREYWNEINLLFVGFGQQICNARKPLCGQCLNREICPVGKKWRPAPPKPARKRSKGSKAATKPKTTPSSPRKPRATGVKAPAKAGTHPESAGKAAEQNGGDSDFTEPTPRARPTPTRKAAAKRKRET